MKQTNLDGCLVQDEIPPKDIMHIFDRLTKAERDSLNDAPIKLCVYCFYSETRNRNRSPSEAVTYMMNCVHLAEKEQKDGN